MNNFYNNSPKEILDIIYEYAAEMIVAENKNMCSWHLKCMLLSKRNVLCDIWGYDEHLEWGCSQLGKIRVNGIKTEFLKSNNFRKLMFKSYSNFAEYIKCEYPTFDFFTIDLETDYTIMNCDIIFADEFTKYHKHIGDAMI